MDFRFCAGTAADHNASVPGKSHQQITGISHSTRNNNRRWPIRCRHFVWRYDAKHKAVCSNGAFGGYTGCRASTAANDSDAKTRERLPRLPGEIVSARTRFGAPEYTYLGLTMAMNHAEAGTNVRDHTPIHPACLEYNRVP